MMRSQKIYFVSLIALLLVGIFVTDAKAPKKLLYSSPAKPGEFKYQVSITRAGSHVCGGALISNSHVLTAAHCFVGKVPPPYTDRLTILTGMTKRHFNGERHFPKYVTIHPDYIEGKVENLWRNDIAVVTLDKPIETTELQAPISLPKSNLLERVTGVISGWGAQSLETETITPSELQKSPVTIITLEECRNRLIALDTNICGFDGKGTGTCAGDSGGPVVFNNEIVGIVSWTISCGIGYPDIYTRVYAYKDFIQSAMQR